MSFSDAYVDISNGIMVNGTLGVYSSQFTGSGIIYAQNSINYSVGEISNSDGGFVVFCAANGDININASNTTINGIIYAPNGTVTITGFNVTINGRIIADKFNFWGSNLTINSGDEIAQRIWTVYHDVNNDGIIDDVEAEVIRNRMQKNLQHLLRCTTRLRTEFLVH